MVYIYGPKTPDGQAELARRISRIHADAVYWKIKELSCPAWQKRALLEEIQRRYKSESVTDD